MGLFTTKLDHAFEFKEKGIQKYMLTIDSLMNLGGFISETTVEIRWQLEVKEIEKEYYLMELITLDNSMVKSDNTGFLEMHRLVSQMNKALHEIKFYIDKKGKLIEIVNLDEIEARWQSVKAELFEYNKNNTSLKELFSIQDKSFENEKGIEKMVRAIEFFMVYLNDIYGSNYPFKLDKKISNIFRSAEIPFTINFDREQLNGSLFKLLFTGKADKVNTKFIEKVYGQFPFIDSNKVIPEYTYSGNYLINEQTGYIRKGELVYKEVIGDKLGGTLHYKLESYE